MRIICITLSVLAFVLAMSCCNQATDSQLAESETLDTDSGCSSRLPANDTTLTLDKREILIRVSGNKHRKGTFLLLHGWNLPPADWCNKTSICDSALQDGYNVVMPDMGKSNYHTQIFPETTPEVRKTPGLLWLTDTLIPHLQNLCLLVEGEKNFIVGLSTGGRGVVLVCMQLPHLFTAAAVMSGDFDQTLMQTDKVHNSFYGPYNEFSERWKTIDNPMSRIAEMNTPVYIAHGRYDKVTQSEQSQMLYDSLRKYHPNLKIRLHLADAGHNYDFWSSETGNIIQFFRELN